MPSFGVIIHEPVAGDRIYPRSEELGAIVGVPTRVDGDQCLLNEILRIRGGPANPRELSFEISAQMGAQPVRSALCADASPSRPANIRVPKLWFVRPYIHCSAGTHLECGDAAHLSSGVRGRGLHSRGAPPVVEDQRRLLASTSA